MLLQKYLELVSDLYAEPKKEESLGFFIVSCMESEPKQTVSVSRKNEITLKLNRIENQNREQNNELQGEVEPEEDSIIVTN